MANDFGVGEWVEETYEEVFDAFDLGRYFCMEYAEWMMCDVKHCVLTFLEENTCIHRVDDKTVIYTIF